MLVERLDHNRGKIHDVPVARFRISRFALDGITVLGAPEIMEVVFAVESVLREQLDPAKVNLASLGTQVPHLHWHVIPRFTDDPHYPQPIWSTARRAREGVLREANTSALAGALAAALD